MREVLAITTAKLNKKGGKARKCKMMKLFRIMALLMIVSNPKYETLSYYLCRH